jgi:hypothetical protein
MTVIENSYDPHVPWHSKSIHPPELREAEARMFSARGSIEVVSHVSTGDALLHVIGSIRSEAHLRIVIRYILDYCLQFVDCPSGDTRALTIAEEACGFVQDKLVEFLRVHDLGALEEKIEKLKIELTESQLDYHFSDPPIKDPLELKKKSSQIQAIEAKILAKENSYNKIKKARNDSLEAIKNYESLLSQIYKIKDDLASKS